MRRAKVMVPKEVVVADMIVILNSLVSQLQKMPDKYAYVKRMRIGEWVPNGSITKVRGIEIHVEGGEEDDTRKGS